MIQNDANNAPAPRGLVAAEHADGDHHGLPLEH